MGKSTTKKLAAILFAASAATAGAADWGGLEDIAWWNGGNLSVEGGSLRKIGGEPQMYDAFATSAQLIAGTGYTQFAASEPGTFRCLGLTAARVSRCEDLAYSVRLQGKAEVYERGEWKAGSAYVAGDVFAIAMENGRVRYLKNGTEWYASQAVAALPMTVEAILVDAGSTIRNAKVVAGLPAGSAYEPVKWTNAVNLAVNDGSLKKTGGQPYLDDASAVSSQRITTNGLLQFAAAEPGTFRCAGLTHGVAASNCGEIDYAVRLQAMAEVYERGQWRAGTSYQAGDVFAVLVRNGKTRYLKNGALWYESTLAPQPPLYAEAIFIDAGSSIADARLRRDADPPRPNQPPIAAIATSVSSYTVNFDARNSRDADGAITAYAWKFGDGASGSGSTATHTYASAGNYVATLTVTDNQGAVGTAVASVQLTAPNAAPVARASATASAPLTASFDGRNSYDPDGTIAAYAWNYGDGSGGSGATPTHAYATAGTYYATLTVTDNRGASASTNVAVTVAPPAPGSVVYGYLPPPQRVGGGRTTWVVPAGYIHQTAWNEAPAADIQGVYAYDFGNWKSLVWRWADTMRADSIQRVIGPGGKPAYRIEIRPTDGASEGTDGDHPRAEFFSVDGAEDRRERTPPRENILRDGDEYWATFAIYVPYDFPDNHRWATLIQRKFQNGGMPATYPAWFTLDVHRGNIDVAMPGTPRDVYTTIGTLAELKGRWTQFTFHEKVSSQADGYFEIFMNGKSKAKRNGATIPAGDINFNFHYGYYRANEKDDKFPTPPGVGVLFYSPFMIMRGTTPDPVPALP